MFLALFYFSRSSSVFAVALLSTANIILASLIILRLVRHQRYVRKVLGAEHGSPYFTVITMSIESSALIVIFSAVYTVLALMQPIQTGSVFVPLLLLPHICVGGLEFYDFLCTSKIHCSQHYTGYLTPPHCLPRC